MRNLFVLIGVAGLAFAACEKSNQPSQPPPGDTAGAPAGEGGAADAGAGDDATAEGGAATEPGAPGVKWADKTFKQRQEWMGIEVMPKMKAAFQAYDASGFASFKCQTCHGNDMAEKKFEMPNDGIYPLNPADPIKGAKDYDEKMTTFMIEQVTPQMAALLDEQVVSKDNPNGFGCMRCHPSE
jgi:hypothetical protein